MLNDASWSEWRATITQTSALTETDRRRVLESPLACLFATQLAESMHRDELDVATVYKPSSIAKAGMPRLQILQ